MKKMIYAGCIGCSVFTAQAQTNTTNSTVLDADNWKNSLEANFEKSGSIAFIDRFGGQSELGWMQINEQFEYGAIDYINRAGINVMQKTALNGIRETVADLPGPKYWSTWAEMFWVGSIGNTPAKDFSMDPLAPTEAKKTLLQKMKEDGNLEYGVHFEDQSAYATIRAGHWFDNSFILHTQVQYQPVDRTRLNTTLIVPMPLRSEICGSISFDLLKSNDRGTIMSVSLSHGLLTPSHLTWYAGIIYRPERHETVYQAGLNHSW